MCIFHLAHHHMNDKIVMMEEINYVIYCII